MGNRNCDRLTLSLAPVVEELFGGWVPPSGVAGDKKGKSNAIVEEV